MDTVSSRKEFEKITWSDDRDALVAGDPQESFVTGDYV
jgi:hypothetical protein